MSDYKVTALGVGVELTSDQRTLIRSVPKVPALVVIEIRNRFGALLPKDEMIAAANLGVALAAWTYEPQSGTPFQQWAYYRAMERVLDACRREMVQRRIRAAQGAVFGFLLAEPSQRERNPFEETDESLKGELRGLAKQMLLSMMHADPGPAPEPETMMVERETWVATRAALARVIDGLDEEDRKIIHTVYEANHHFTEAARLLAMPYWTLVRRHHSLMGALRKRFAALGVRQAPNELDGYVPSLFGRETADTVPDDG